MSSIVQVSSSSTPNFQPIFEKALEEYKKKTGKDLTAHPLAAQIKGCNSPEAILTVLERKANELKQSRSGDERLSKRLNPTVNILNQRALCHPWRGRWLGKSQEPSPFVTRLCPNVIFKVFPPTKIIFSGINILLVVSFLAQFSAWVVRTLPLAGGEGNCGEPRCASRTL
jgi:hypothetical protein